MNRPTSNALPLVSFGLPVRNGAPTIAQAIESVLAQTFEDWELVISDNLSTDGTSEICASFAARDERIRHVPTGRDLSIHDNFRAAFRHSRGTYFRWHGDDDWLEPEYAERAVAALEASAGSVLCTTVQQHYRDGHPLPVNDPIPDPRRSRLAGRGSRVRALLHLFQNGGHLGIDPVYSLVRRDVAAQTGLQGSIRDGDFVYSCEMALLGPFVHVPEVLAHRRLLPVNRLGISRNFLQREQSILCVARASKSLTTRSRVQVCAALLAFATKEHAHGLRRRARAIRERSRTRLTPDESARSTATRAPAQDDLGHLGASEEPERDEGRARAGRDVHCAGGSLVHARDKSCSGMGERDPPSRQWETDLAGVEMARQDQVERAARDPMDDAGEVA